MEEQTGTPQPNVLPPTPPIIPPTLSAPKRSPLILVLLVVIVIALFAAGGYYLGTTNLLMPQPVASPVVYASPQPVASTDPTAEWKTYDANGITFKYPVSFVVCETEAVIGLISSGTYDASETDPCGSAAERGYLIAIYQTENDDLFQNWHRDNYPNSFSNFAEKTISVGNYEAIQISGLENETNIEYSVIKIEKQEDSFVIIVSYGLEQAILDQVISTFKFL